MAVDADCLNSLMAHLKNGPCQVIGFYMHLRDNRTLQGGTPFLFDVVLTDGKLKLKCQFDTGLNHLIERGYITVGSCINVTQIRVQDLCVVVESFDDSAALPVPDLTTLQFVHSNNPRIQLQLPLRTTKLYYLHPWVTDVPCGHGIFGHNPALTQDTPLDALQPMTLLDFDKDAQTMMLPYPRLVVTVLQRGKLHHFANSDGDKRDFPFQGYLILADHTAVCRAVVWESRIERTWIHLNPGCVLLIGNYKSKATNPTFQISICGKNRDLPFIRQEISFNMTTQIRILRKQDAYKLLPANALYPKLEYRLVPRSLQSHLAPNATVDVVGVVTYMGHFMREKVPKKTDQFFVYRWIEVVDNTSSVPFRIQLFVHWPVNKHTSIKLGDVLLFRQLRHVRTVLPMKNSRDPRPPVYLTTTVYSTIEDKLASLRDVDRVREVLNWANRCAQNLTSRYRVGGFVSYPFIDDTSENENWLSAFLETAETPCGSAWEGCLKTLKVREHRMVLLKGTITAVHLLKVDGATASKELFHYDIKNHKQRSLASANWSLAFPQLVSSEYTKKQLDWLNLPRFCASADRSWPALTEEERDAIPYARVDGYLLTILSEDKIASVTALFFPKSTCSPHPSLNDLLRRRYREKGFVMDERTKTASATYSTEEIKTVKDSCTEVNGKEFRFLVDLFSYHKEIVVAILRLALDS